MSEDVGVRSDGFYRTVVDTIPSPVLVVEQDVRIVDVNAAAAQLLASTPERTYRRRAGEVMCCIHSQESTGRPGLLGQRRLLPRQPAVPELHALHLPRMRQEEDPR